ncbi:MAG: TonB-dependent receptor [Bacteroidota bacterium]
MKKYGFWWMGLLLSSVLMAQSDTSLVLPTVEIQASRIKRFGTGLVQESLSPKVLLREAQSPLSEVLSRHSPIFIRNYGPGSLSTASSRGTGYGRTAFLWNGFTLESPMNGGNDLSLLPSLLFNELNIQYGSSSSLSGSGAIGGSIRLNNRPMYERDSQLRLLLTAGSFSDYRQAIQWQMGKQKWAAQWAAFHQQAENDFSYEDKGQEQRLENNALRQYGSMGSIHWRPNVHHQFSSHLWYQNSDRQLPPTLTTSNNEEEQEDEALRLATEWRYVQGQMLFKTRMAYLYDRLLYLNPLLDPSLSKTHSYDLQSETIRILPKSQEINLGVQWRFQRADAPQAFPESPDRGILALFAAYKKRLAKDWTLAASLRQEWSEEALVPLTGSLGLDKKINPSWTLSAQVSRSHRLPTFNDLYWAGEGGIGNPSLEAEVAWNQEISLRFDRSLSNKIFVQELTLYSHYVDNWILWAPITVESWQPDNLQKVWSRGLTYQLQFRFNFVNWTLNSQVRYTLTRATNEQAPNGDPDNVLGKQLIQTPVHLANVHLDLSYKKMQLAYFHQISSRQYSAPDHSESIDGFHIGQLSLSYRLSLGSHRLFLNGQIQNLWNQNYQVVPFRPMPLRHFRLHLRFDL